MALAAAAIIDRLLDPDASDFGWVLHRPSIGDHLLLTCEVPTFWRTMPTQAVRTAIAQHITTWMATLTPGLGVVAWGRGDQPEVLVIAADQETAELEAKIVSAYLADVNPPPSQPPPPPAPECGCTEHGWHLITCLRSGEPVAVAGGPAHG
jgi:hypothetical protein